jgi:single-strand DNA-binding protein
MAGSVNKVILIGNLGSDPEARSMQSGDEVVNFSVATSERWKDKASGEWKEKTQWHKVVIFNQGLVNVAKNYLHKGSKVYIEGQLETRDWEDKEGRKQYTTEVVLRPFRGELTMLDSKNSGGSQSGGYANDRGSAASSGGASSGGYGGGAPASSRVDEMEDDIPF